MPKLAVSEIFGPTFQGEGPSLGRRAIFLRLSGCNLKCSWCDTKYTWDWTQYDIHEQTKIMDLDDVLAEFEVRVASMTDNVILVITGGEPLLQWRALEALFSDMGLWELFDRIEIETNGTIGPAGLGKRNIHFNVSPKLKNSGNGDERWMAESFVDEPNAIFKFVCRHKEDLEEVARYQRSYGLPDEQIWIMPEGRHPSTLQVVAGGLTDEVLRRGWNMTTRMHVLLWGDERGR